MIFPVRTMPLDLPRKILCQTWDMPQTALVYSLGTPAQKLMIDTACWLHRAGKVDRVLIVVGDLHLGAWSDQRIINEVPEDIELVLAHHDREVPINVHLIVKIVHCNFMERFSGEVENFLYGGHGRSMIVVDNAISALGNNSYASMFLRQVSHHAPFRRIMMGALPRVPHLAWGAYAVLSGDGPHVLGFPSPIAMRARFNDGDKYRDLDIFEQKILSAPTFFLDKEEMKENYPKGIYIYSSFSYLPEILKELPPKIVIVNHREMVDASFVLRCLGEQGNQLLDNKGIVLCPKVGPVGALSCPERREFFNSDKAQVLILDHKIHLGRLDCAHAIVHVMDREKANQANPCDTICAERFDSRVEWNENRHVVTRVYC